MPGISSVFWARPSSCSVAALTFDTRADATGYRSSTYAHSLAEFGTPRSLQRSGGWILERSVERTSRKDAMGCYPLFSCRNWAELKNDIDDLAGDLLSLSLVTDPFGDCDGRDLQSCFPDKLIPFKLHWIADLRRPRHESVSKHHRYYAKRALCSINVERCDTPQRHLEEWSALYDHLIVRHRLRGMKAFSRHSFGIQLGVPGIVMLRARHEGETVGAHLWMLQDDVVHSHLAAASPTGYDMNVGYALYWAALEMFADEARWINFGAGAGVSGGSESGLTQFKRGWATETRPSFFCGRIFDHAGYAAAGAARGNYDDDYFPAYRSGEFS
jgi:hypothetical protein